MKNYPESITIKLTPKQLQALEPLKKRFKKLAGDRPVGAIFANIFLFDNMSNAPIGTARVDIATREQVFAMNRFLNIPIKAGKRVCAK